MHTRKNVKSKTDARGGAVREFCESRGLLQLVARPTRGEAILEMVIGAYEGNVSHLPHCGSSDHQTLLVSLDRILETPCAAPKRRVYHWKRAAWNRMIGDFQSTEWDLQNDVDAAVDKVTMRITAVTNKGKPNYGEAFPMVGSFMPKDLVTKSRSLEERRRVDVCGAP